MLKRGITRGQISMIFRDGPLALSYGYYDSKIMAVTKEPVPSSEFLKGLEAVPCRWFHWTMARYRKIWQDDEIWWIYIYIKCLEHIIVHLLNVMLALILCAYVSVFVHCMHIRKMQMHLRDVFLSKRSSHTQVLHVQYTVIYTFIYWQLPQI